MAMTEFLSPAIIYGLTALALFVIGFAGLIAREHPLHKIMAANIMAGGVFLFLVTIGYGDGEVIDPIPHAMVLTGIVVSVSCTALALALTRRIMENAGLRASGEHKGEEAGSGEAKSGGVDSGADPGEMDPGKVDSGEMDSGEMDSGKADPGEMDLGKADS